MEKCVGRIFFNEGKKTEEYGLKNIFWKKINEEDHTVSHRSGCYSLKTVMRPGRILFALLGERVADDILNYLYTKSGFLDKTNLILTRSNRTL